MTGAKDGATVQTINGLTVPKEGDWTMKTWLRDAAGNNTTNNAGPVLHLRLDSQAPTAVFSPIDPANPTRVVVQASDATSGVASGSIDFKPQAATDWVSVPARLESGRLVATLPDETMADGVYDLRGHAVDRAGNERSTTDVGRRHTDDRHPPGALADTNHRRPPSNPSSSRTSRAIPGHPDQGRLRASHPSTRPPGRQGQQSNGRRPR